VFSIPSVRGGRQVRVFEDLDTRQELVLGSGHVEQNGAVVRSQAGRPKARRRRAVRAPATTFEALEG
jgi:hypothetical protein